jgi:23S rRNA (adenine1618-N6)-methyltransferase
MVSKEANLPLLKSALKRIQATNIQTLEMTQGQTKSRVLCWTFKDRQKPS